MSTPAAVSVGAVPPAQSTDAGQFTVWLPPLVKIRVKEQAVPVADGLLKVNVLADVSTVADTTLPKVRSMS